MPAPLKQWICDTCCEIIKSPEEGWVEWLQDKSDPHKAYDFRIEHHATYSPHALGGGNCYKYDQNWNRAGNPLSSFVGEDGLAYLLSFLDSGRYISPDYNGPEVSDIRGFVELIRRLHMPYYKEARHFFDAASDDGFFDDVSGHILRPERLKQIIEIYGSQPV